MKTLEAQAKEGRINENASIRDRQSIMINAPIQLVWDVLTNINKWPEWYSEIKSASCEKVEEGAFFEWALKSTHLKSKFQLVEKPTRLSWTGKSKMVKAIHVWDLESADDQTILTVEKSIEGFLIPVFNRQSKVHDDLMAWIAALKNEAEK
ncbi:MAG: hypothetical protein GY816_02480 [Cytophagales bacterium]|nr:hypothetical protein [Cytophagales bacterium]